MNRGSKNQKNGGISCTDSFNEAPIHESGKFRCDEYGGLIVHFLQ